MPTRAEDCVNSETCKASSIVNATGNATSAYLATTPARLIHDLISVVAIATLLSLR